MQPIKGTVYRNDWHNTPPIKVTYGSSVPIQLTVADLDTGDTISSPMIYARGFDNNETYENQSNVSPSGRTVTFTPDEGLFVPGDNMMILKLTVGSGGANNFVYPVVVHCLPNPALGSIPSKPVVVKDWATAAEKAMQEAKEWAEKAQEAAASIPTDIEQKYESLRGNLADAEKRLNESITEIAAVEISPNLLNPAGIVRNKFISIAENALVYKDNVNLDCFLLPVEAGKTYAVSGVSYYGSGFSDDLRFVRHLINSSASVDAPTFTVPTTSPQIKYVAISWNKGRYPTESFMIVEGSALPSEYKPYGWSSIEFSDAAVDDMQRKISPDFAKIDDVIDLSENLSDQKKDTVYFDRTNLFDKAKCHEGYFVSGAVGETIRIVSNAQMAWYQIDVSPDTYYTLSGIDYFLILTDDGDKIIALYNGNANHVAPYTFSFANQSITKAYFSFKPALTPISTYMAVIGETLPSEYIERNYVINERYMAFLKANLEGGQVFHVGSDKEFTSFTECLRSLQGNENPKTILVDAGTYDIFEEMGGRDFALSIPDGTHWRDCNVVVPSNTTIRGIGYVKFVFLPELSDIGTVAINLLSPLNITGSVTVENINIEAKNCRYAIHDDGSVGRNNDQSTHIYRNVTAEKYGNGYAPAFGSGIGLDSQMEFVHCIFKSNTIPWSVHNQWWACSGNIIFDGCAIIGTNPDAHSIRFSSLATKQSSDNSAIKCVISNSHINADVYFGNEDGDSNRGVPYAVTAIKSGDVTYTKADSLADYSHAPVTYN